jgi:hypothetical protein
MHFTSFFTAASLASLLLAPSAFAGKFTVNAQDNIYGAGQTSAPGGGNVPTAILKLSRKSACVTVTKVTGSLTCTEKSGCIVLNLTSGDNLNDPDGTGAAPATSSNSGAGSISGITAPLAGYLVGLFAPAKGPAGTAPAALNFVTTGTNFAQLSPLLDQTFFVGDGHTGDRAGAVQYFSVPAGARRLYFGISDACNYNGGPGCYDDNQGSYRVVAKASDTACP